MAGKRRQSSKFFSAGGAAFSSASDDWATPPHVFEALDAEFDFELDAAASPTNAKCPRFYTPADDGLAQEWTGTVWVNPPYERYITEKWIEKAADSADAGATVVALIPARTCTKWWHRHVMERADEVRLIEGRLKFGVGTDSAPFPSAVVIYGPGGRASGITAPRFSAWKPTPR